MTTLYHPARRVKKARRFGAGILRSLPTAKAEFTDADAAWWTARNAEAGPDWDALAADAEVEYSSAALCSEGN